MTDRTIPGLLLAQAEARPDAPAYSVRGPNGWEATSWRTYADQVREAALSLIALGITPGSSVTILGFNRPEWVIMDLGAMSMGAVPAGIYTSCSASEVMYILAHSEAPVLLVDSVEQWEKVRANRASAPALRCVVFMSGIARPNDPLCLSWEEFIERGKLVEPSEFDARFGSLRGAQPATMIYTSGTTGPPKAVMLSHENLAWTATTGVEAAGLLPGDVGLSYLPLAHIAEQVFSIHAPAAVGGHVHFAQSIDKVAEHLKEMQPTVFFGVPRIWEKFYEGMTAKLALATGFKAKLAGWAQRVGRAFYAKLSDGARPSLLLRMKMWIADRLVHRKVRAALGLGRARVLVSGAAPISRNVLEFLSGFGMLVLEVYGQSEDTGPTTFNRPDKFRIGTVGPPFPGVDVKIAQDGEILVRGPNVFLGYFKDGAASAEALADGWLHSGDIGEFDADGFLKITGRKKDLIITAGGKNIAPRNLEDALCAHPLIGEAVAIGDRRKFLTALVTLAPEPSAKFAAEHKLPMERLHQNPTLIAELMRHVDQMNADVARVEQIKKITVLPRPLSIESGELTPTLKIRRNVVAQHFSKEIEAMYAE